MAAEQAESAEVSSQESQRSGEAQGRPRVEPTRDAIGARVAAALRAGHGLRGMRSQAPLEGGRRLRAHCRVIQAARSAGDPCVCVPRRLRDPRVENSAASASSARQMPGAGQTVPIGATRILRAMVTPVPTHGQGT